MTPDPNAQFLLPSMPIEPWQARLPLAGVYILELDAALQVAAATPGACERLTGSGNDAGRLADLPYGGFASDVARVIVDGDSLERRASGRGGGEWLVRAMPAQNRRHAVFHFIELPHDESVAAVGQIPDSTDDYAMLTLDPDGLITSWNNGAQHVFGHTRNEVLGRHVDLIFVPADRAHGAAAAEMGRARLEGRAEDERWHLRKDGTRVYCSGVMTPLRDGHLHGYAKIARDMTARKRAERAREAMLRYERRGRTRAQAANQLKDEFLAVMSHELKHPLNLIHANAELLTRLPDVQACPAGQKAARIIQRAVLSQAKIIDDLLDLSRLHTGKLRLNRRNIDWHAVVEDVTRACASQARAAGIDLAFESDGGIVMLDADEVRIEQITWNLLHNAIKFTPAGGQIRVRLRREPEFARLEVADTGRGIAAATLPHIFAMFRQAEEHTTRRDGGLGVGLALVRQLTELHGGRVAAHSDGSGLGATFTVWLPLCVTEAPAQTLAADAFASLAGLRVLLVDDSIDTLEAFGQLLTLEGAEVALANDGPAGLQRARAEVFDLVLSDIGMPGMDGHEFLTRLRELDGYASLPAVALTGFGRPEDVRRALAAGFSAHVSKPVQIETLVQVLRAHGVGPRATPG